MPSQSKRQNGNYDSPAGIIALTSPDGETFSPHREVIKRILDIHGDYFDAYRLAAGGFCASMTGAAAEASRLKGVGARWDKIVYTDASSRSDMFGLSTQARLDIYSDGLARGFDHILKKQHAGPTSYRLKGRCISGAWSPGTERGRGAGRSDAER